MKIIRNILISLALLLSPLLTVAPVHAATFTVSKVADTNDGTCDADCSLREAITAANAAGGADTINFSIPGSGLHTIQPTSQLPIITSPVTINGYSQTGSSANTAVAPNPFNGTLTIELDGQLAGGPNVNGLVLDTGSSGSTIRGLIINRFSFDGIEFLESSNNTIAGNYIGVDSTGLINRGNGARGVGGSTGFNADGNTIGGTNPEDRNIASGNNDGGGGVGNEGIGGCNVCDDWTIQGNYAGLGSDGQTVIANEDGGVTMGSGSTGHTIGGIAGGARNVIAGNHNSTSGSQVFFDSDTSMINNIIGTDYMKTQDVSTSAFSAIIVGSNNTIQGNTIKNGINAGLIIAGGSNNLVGGTSSSQANVVAENGGGIYVTSVGGSGGLNNSIIGNSVYNNFGGALSELGIDLLGNTNDFSTFSDLGVTPNDAGDSDVTSNHLMNFPVLSSSTSSNGQVTITYSLDINDSESGATGYRVEFFSNDSAGVQGYGQGQTLLGSDTIAGDVTNRQVTLNLPDGVSGTKYLSATTTMTDSSTDGYGHTSEFSAVMQANLVAASSSSTSSQTSSSGLADTGENNTLLSAAAVLLLLAGAVGALLYSRRSAKTY